MNGYSITVVALVTLLVTAGTAGAVAGVGAPPTDDRDAAANAAGERAAASSPVDARGPVVSLPEQIPERVGEVRDLIREFLVGDLVEPLGAAIEDVAPGEDGDHAHGVERADAAERVAGGA